MEIYFTPERRINMNFETVIGIEIHCELKTKSKMFSSAANAFDAEPNTNVHVNDLAFPGIMPVLNKKAVEAGFGAVALA